jgi:hypothetical protein
VETLGDKAFAYCISLGEILIPASVCRIGCGVFIGCSALQRIQVEKDNLHYDSRENCDAIVCTKSNTLIAGCRNSRIPETVEQIGEYAFFDIHGLRSITIPDRTARICHQAFDGCVDLEEIRFGRGLTHIETFAFHRCERLTDLDFPRGLREIETWAFAGCRNLTRPVRIPIRTHVAAEAFPR